VLGGVVVEILGSLEGGEEDPLGGDVGVQDSGDDKGRKTESVRNPLDERSSTTESGGGDVLARVVVDLKDKRDELRLRGTIFVVARLNVRQCRQQYKDQW